MKYLKNEISEKIVINKSEFIGILYPVFNIEDVNTAILDAKRRYPKATHYVTAFIIGKNKELMQASDDGEPSRTAGYPILEVLMQNDITNILCVSIRYFGGIKLGAGGLVRAYRKSIITSLEKASFYIKRRAKKYEITFSYNLIDKIEHLLKDCANIIRKDYLESVTYEFIFLEKDISIFDNIKNSLIINEKEEAILHIDL